MDSKTNFLNSVKLNLCDKLETDDIQIVIDSLIYIMNEYEITPSTTEVAIVDDTNTKLIKLYSACLLVDGLSQKTIKVYTDEVKRVLVFLNKNVDEIAEYDIRYYLGCEKNRGIENSTLENKRSFINAFFRWAELSKHIPANPCELIKPIKIPKKIRKPFSNVELERIKASCQNSKERAIVELLSSSGVRVSELSNLDVSDINFEKNIVLVRNGKGGKDRITFMNDISSMYLKEYLEKRECSSTALFTSNKGRLTKSGIEYILHQVGNRAGVSKCHPHRFRRTMATKMIDKGAGVQDAQKLLGHTNINTTLTYIYSDDDKISETYKKALS